MDIDIHEYWCRFDMLIDYIDVLSTTTVTQNISKEDRKQYFFETSPIKWRQEFISTKCINLYATTVEDIKQFMIRRKKEVDAKKIKEQKELT